jgi:hypothetical protein
MVWDVQISRLHTGVIPPLLKSITVGDTAPYETMSAISGKTDLLSRFSTVVLTDEPRANIRACGFASAGRHVAFIALLYL